MYMTVNQLTYGAETERPTSPHHWFCLNNSAYQNAFVDFVVWVRLAFCRAAFRLQLGSATSGSVVIGDARRLWARATQNPPSSQLPFETNSRRTRCIERFVEYYRRSAKSQAFADLPIGARGSAAAS
jgi:hypothetical protein